MNLNIVTTSQGNLTITRSNQGTVPIPFHMGNYRALADYLNEFIPSTYRDEIKSLYDQERAIINKRRELLAQYKLELPAILAPILLDFPKTHPEFFI